MRKRLITIVMALGAAGCLPPSQQDIETAQALVEMGDAVNDIRAVLSEMQGQIDSLKFVMARQDTVIRQLANLAGVQVPR
jgi:hypothetical protein